MRRSKVAHFYALPHGDECDITRSYGDPWEDDDTDRTVAHWEQRNTTLIVRILTDQDEGSADNASTGEPTESESRSRAGGDQTRSTNSVSRGPQKLLEQLVHWPSFKTSSMTIRMPGNDRPEVAVHDAFVRFEAAIMAQHTGRWLGFWGLVRSWSIWQGHNTYFSNFGPRTRASVSPFTGTRSPLSSHVMAYRASMRWLATIFSFSITPESQAQGVLWLMSIRCITSDSCGTIKVAE